MHLLEDRVYLCLYRNGSESFGRADRRQINGYGFLFSLGDADIGRDYSAYRAKNRNRLEEYLEKLSRSKFLEEARRQSILAGNSPNEDEDVWLEHADTTEWK